MIRLSLMIKLAVAALLMLLVTPIQANPTPFPADWFWGDAAQLARHNELVGRQLPEFDLAGWMNGQVSPEDMKGKIVLIDFWATWCGPCIAGIPKMNGIQEKYKDQGVIVLGICGSSNGQDRMEAVAREHGIRFPIAKDHKNTAAQAMRVMW